MCSLVPLYPGRVGGARETLLSTATWDWMKYIFVSCQVTPECSSHMPIIYTRPIFFRHVTMLEGLDPDILRMQSSSLYTIK